MALVRLRDSSLLWVETSSSLDFFFFFFFPPLPLEEGEEGWKNGRVIGDSS